MTTVSIFYKSWRRGKRNYFSSRLFELYFCQSDIVPIDIEDAKSTAISVFRRHGDLSPLSDVEWVSE